MAQLYLHIELHSFVSASDTPTSPPLILNDLARFEHLAYILHGFSAGN